MNGKEISPDVREGSILDAFVDLADSLVDDYDPLDFLYRLLDHSLPLTGAVAGAVLLHYEGSLHLVASSNEDAEAVGLHEVQNSRGPARDAYESGEIVRVPSVDSAAERWPDFVAAAASNNWAAVLAIPLRLRSFVVGSFVLFWPDKSTRPDVEDEQLLRGFADVATIAVLQQRGQEEVEAANRQLHTALASRTKIEQAKGMIAQATGVRMGEAFDLLRRHSRSTRTRIAEVSAAVIAGDLEIATLT